jgi:Ca-activated chloride channel family protein
VKDDAGQFVKSHLDEASLKAIAEATGGLYAPLGAQGQGLDTIYQQSLASLAKHELALRRQRVYTERFQWPLAASLVLLLASQFLGTRRRLARKLEALAPVAGTARAQLLAYGTAMLLGGLLFNPFGQANASPVTAEKAYQKGDFATAQRDYAAAAQHDPKTTDLRFNLGTAAYKAGQFPQAAEAFQQSLGGEPSADPQRLTAQEDAYYNLGNALYRIGQKTEPGNPGQTIQSWEQAVKTYDAALQLRANDPDAKYNRDFVKRKLDEFKRQQEQQQKEQKQNQQNQKQDQKDKDPQKQSGHNSDAQKPPNQDHKPDQQKPSGQKSETKNPENKDQKSGAAPKPDQPKDQRPANSGSKPDPQKQPDQKGPQPAPAKGQPQGNAQAPGSVDQHKDEAAPAADAQREPGQMSQEEARNLLDSLKDEQRRFPTSPLARDTGANNPPDKPFKNW